jgi:3-oxoacyl-[acyl-carrier protein] reductase
MMVPVDLEGQVAFVSGAGAGIGAACTRRLLEAGCHVVVNIHSLKTQAQAQIAEWEDLFPDRTIVVEGSIADTVVIDSVVKKAFERFRRLDIVVNNAGIMRGAYIGMIDDATLDATLRVNLASVIRVTQATARLMKRGKSGSIINISSIIGIRGNAGQMVYGAAKAGVIGATVSAAKELAAHGIRVNAVAPGMIDTALLVELPPENRAAVSSQIAMGRLGAPEDVADAVLFLASPLSRYMTGQVLGVDGGMVL